MALDVRVDALLPNEMAEKAEAAGVKKAKMPTLEMFFLAILAGAFIALGAIFATTVASGNTNWPYGVIKLLVGVSFSLGLILVIVGGAELFTGNNLIAMAWASRKVKTICLLRNWIIVYLGNLVGSVGVAALVFAARQYTFGGGVVGKTALAIANGKVHLGFMQALALGVLCNMLVCLAVWLTFSARSTVDKIAAILFPITAFVAVGFEHSIANMFFIPRGLFIKQFDPGFAAQTGLDLTALTWGNFLFHNLLPVTLGNIIGGSLLVAGFYWAIYLRGNHKTA